MKYALHLHTKNVRRYAEFVEICAKQMQKYAKICKYLHISIYASLEMPLCGKSCKMLTFANHATCCNRMIAISWHHQQTDLSHCPNCQQKLKMWLDLTNVLNNNNSYVTTDLVTFRQRRIDIDTQHGNIEFRRLFCRHFLLHQYTRRIYKYYILLYNVHNVTDKQS